MLSSVTKVTIPNSTVRPFRLNDAVRRDAVSG